MPSPVPKTITFAMRHRALRAVSLLCPQYALEKVISSEHLIPVDSSGQSITLNQCTFGAFVAKEIEEMGLTLPHDDLVLLSSMHFLSYARTLWRDHRSTVAKRSKGRLLLLFVEMSLRSVETDKEFVEERLRDMISLRLPRTLLLATERIVRWRRRRGSPRSSGSSAIRADSDLSPGFSRIQTDASTRSPNKG